MLTDQLTSILNDTTAIERLKKEQHHGKADPESCLLALSETFGRPCSLMWLVPTSVKFNGLTYEQLSSTELAFSVPYDADRHGASSRGHRHSHGAHCRHGHGHDDDDDDDDDDLDYAPTQRRGGAARVANLSDSDSESDDEPLAPRFARALSGSAAPEHLAPRSARPADP